MRQQGKPSGQSGRGPGLSLGAQPSASDQTREALEGLGSSTGMMRTQVGYSTAIQVQVPRDVLKVVERILYEAGQMGTDFVYSWRVKDKNSKDPDGKSPVEGISIEGAMIMARNWGNVATPIQLESESPSHYLFDATFIDLETGFQFNRMFRQRKSAVQAGGMEADRKEDIAFQVGQSKAIRNIITAAMPGWLKDQAVEKCKSSAAKKYENVAEHIPKVIAYAAGLGIPEARLIARLGKPKDAWTPYDIVYLRTIFKGIAEKQSTAADEFGTDAPAAATDTVTVTPSGAEVITPGGPPEPAARASVDDMMGPRATPTPQPAVTAPATPPPPATPVPKTAEQVEAEQAEAALSAKEQAAAQGPTFTVPPFVKPGDT